MAVEAPNFKWALSINNLMDRHLEGSRAELLLQKQISPLLHQDYDRPTDKISLSMSAAQKTSVANVRITMTHLCICVCIYM